MIFKDVNNMETKINIAEILKDKPISTKLYDLVRNINVYLTNNPDSCNGVYCTFVKNGIQKLRFSSKGTLVGFENGMIVLAPSKSMQDWSKFTWKRGDVLIDDAGHKVFFDKWENDDYTKFFGSVKVHCYDTEDYTLASKEEAQEFIKSTEKAYGGKLNLETLEIEKQPEFKDGDIITMHKKNCDIVFIFNRWREKDSFYYYAFHTCNTDNTGIINERIRLPYEWMHVDNKISPATDSEKQQLFKALAKENKAWDAKKKQIVDLKPEVKLKPFDKVLVRDSKSDYWRATLFSHINENGCYYCVWASWTYCIPYEGNESLLGTTKDVEG